MNITELRQSAAEEGEIKLEDRVFYWDIKELPGTCSMVEVGGLNPDRIKRAPATFTLKIQLWLLDRSHPWAPKSVAIMNVNTTTRSLLTKALEQYGWKAVLAYQGVSPVVTFMLKRTD